MDSWWLEIAARNPQGAEVTGAACPWTGVLFGMRSLWLLVSTYFTKGVDEGLLSDRLFAETTQKLFG
jgi:hypothetical protein